MRAREKRLLRQRNTILLVAALAVLWALAVSVSARADSACTAAPTLREVTVEMPL